MASHPSLHWRNLELSDWRDIASRLVASRAVRFIIVGGISGVAQIVFLAIWLHFSSQHRLGNLVAFLLSAQINFALNQLVTWHSTLAGSSSQTTLTRWVKFHGAIAVSAVINQVVYNVAVLFVPILVSAALAILFVAGFNFVMLNRFVFQARRPASPIGPVPTPESASSASMPE